MEVAGTLQRGEWRPASRASSPASCTMAGLYTKKLAETVQVLRKTQVAPSGHFLVARTNFGMSYMARKERGRHRNCPKKCQAAKKWPDGSPLETVNKHLKSKQISVCIQIIS